MTENYHVTKHKTKIYFNAEHVIIELSINSKSVRHSQQMFKMSAVFSDKLQE